MSFATLLKPGSPQVSPGRGGDFEGHRGRRVLSPSCSRTQQGCFGRARCKTLLSWLQYFQTSSVAEQLAVLPSTATQHGAQTHHNKGPPVDPDRFSSSVSYVSRSHLPSLTFGGTRLLWASRAPLVFWGCPENPPMTGIHHRFSAPE